MVAVAGGRCRVGDEKGLDKVKLGETPFQRNLRTARWSTRVSLGLNFDRNVTSFSPPTALKLIARGKLTFDEQFVLHRVKSEEQTLKGWTVSDPKP